MDRTCEKQTNSKGNKNRKTLILKIRKTAEISGAYYEEGRLGKFNTPKMRRRGREIQRKRYLMSLCEWMA